MAATRAEREELGRLVHREDGHRGHAAYPTQRTRRPRRVAGRRPVPPGAPYGDATVANRDIRVWHGATEKGP